MEKVSKYLDFDLSKPSRVKLFTNFLLLMRLCREPLCQKEKLSELLQIFLMFSSKVKNPQISECTCLCASAKPNGGVQTFEIGKMAAIDGFINRGLSFANTRSSMTPGRGGGGILVLVCRTLMIGGQ